MKTIDQTSFTEFGGELGNKLRPTLEEIDMKYDRFNLLFWRLDVADSREKKELIFDGLASPVKKMAIPQHGPRHKFTKLHNYRYHKIPRRFTQADKNNNVHTLIIKLTI